MLKNLKVGVGEMHTLLPKWETDNFKLLHQVIDENTISLNKMKDMVEGKSEYKGAKAGTYTVLLDKRSDEVVMSDTMMELTTNMTVLNRAHGDVLIGGFGIGFILMNMQYNPRVKSITVVELEPDIIEHNAKMLPLNEKVTVVQGDIMTWTPPKDVKYDTIYFDIWNFISPKNVPEMGKLHKRFNYKLKDTINCYIGSWRRNDCQRMRAQERRELKKLIEIHGKETVDAAMKATGFTL